MRTPTRLPAMAVAGLLLVLASHPSSARPKPPEGVWLPISFGHYGFFIPQDKIQRSPNWNEEQSDPPLALEEAVKKAEQFAKTQGYGPPQCASVMLGRLEAKKESHKWYYAVHFDGPGSQNLANSPFGVVVVLMNGEIIPALAK